VTRYRVVPGSSSIDTEVRSSVHPIHGGWVEIPVEAIRSGNRLTDLEMQRRAEVSRYPTIRFEVTRAWPVNGTDRYRAAVSVTAHGRTQAFEEDFRLQRNGGRVVLDGQHTFDMRDFGVNPPRILTLRVEPQVKVSVRLVAEEED